jgi:small GTP-binding protein
MERAKVVIIGDSGVGKTSIFQRIQTNQFDPDIFSTICGAYASLNIKYENQNVNIGIWDTAGQERFRSVVPIFFKGTQYLIIVYAINELKSLDNVQFWFNLSQIHSSSNCKIILVGNKSDLSWGVQISDNQIEFIQNKINSIASFKVSALDGSNIEILLKFIADDIIQSNPDLFTEKIIDAPNSSIIENENQSLGSTFSLTKCC